MKKLFYLLLPITMIVSSCGETSNEANSATEKAKETTDTTITGVITDMSYSNVISGASIGASGFSVTVNDEIKLYIVKDNLGDEGLRIFINDEAKDILLIDKENSVDMLNLNKYLDKNVEVTFDKKENKILSLKLLGGDQPISNEEKTSVGIITNLNPGRIISLKQDNGETKDMLIYQDEEGRITISSIYFSDDTKKEDYVFARKDGKLILLPNENERKVEVTSSIKLIKEETMSPDGNTRIFNFYYGEAVTEIKWIEEEK